MIKISNIKIPVNHNEEMLKTQIAKKLKYNQLNIKKFEIIKKSIDARDKNNIIYVYNVVLEMEKEDKYLKLKDISKYEKVIFSAIKSTKKPKTRPVVIGFGPCGIFCSLILAEAGLNPIILERGKDVISRKNDIELFLKTRMLNEDSNIQFGEGGAGTFSDGKLTTGIKDIRINKIIDELILHGAPEEIKYIQKPHIGTDYLIKIMQNIRKKIISLGAEINFSSKLIDFEIIDNNINSITYLEDNKLRNIYTDNLILSLGHSARDTFEMLYNKKITINQKPFAIGFRIEHKQELINKSQFGKFYNCLPAADYKLNVHTKNNRGVYTFCMCPGGKVVSAVSENNRIVTNGMSYFKRDCENSNSALLVEVTQKDFNSNHPLAGINFQRHYEEKAFQLGGSNYYAPIQLVGDYLNDIESKNIGTVKPSYEPGTKLTNLNNLFEKELNDSLKEGIIEMDKVLEGFKNYDSVLTGVETRSSSPIRILRDHNFESNFKGIYPCGEGAGYAGGIISAAVDGIKCAEAVIKKINI